MAGVILFAGGAWHLGYLACTRPGRHLFLDLLARRRDLLDLGRVLKCNLGLAPDKPAFGRSNYREKVEDWAMVWGSLRPAVTGVIFWFDNTSISLFSKQGFDV